MAWTGFGVGQNAPGIRHLGKTAGVLALPFIAMACPTQAAPMPPIPAPALVRATPALWEIRDADTTIYLFGSFHAVDDHTAWMEDRVRKAFNDADELVLESVPPSNPGEIRRMGAQAGADRSGFMTSMRTAMSQARASGMSSQAGTDAVLRRLAEDRGKKVSGLEEFGSQLRSLSNIPASASPASPTPDNHAVTIISLFASWRSGNEQAFADVVTSLKDRSPQVYDALIAQPNARWGQWIANRLQRPGIVFVAVGSGHLAGKDSVQQWLAARGITASRIG